MEKTCKRCQKKFKLIAQELEFYEKMGLPTPDNCPACRHELRVSTRNGREFYKYPCAKCGQDMVTTVKQNSGYTVYCQKCYDEFRASVDLTKI